jgi:uncharacterized membrane protein
MLKTVKEVIVSSVVLIVLDMAFLYVNKDAFRNLIASVQRVIVQFKPEGAIICYLLLVFVINYFIISKKRSILEAFMLGFVINGVYESTNYAFLKKWSPYLAIMDTLWGGTLFATTTAVTYAVL